MSVYNKPTCFCSSTIGKYGKEDRKEIEGRMQKACTGECRNMANEAKNQKEKSRAEAAKK